MVGVGWRVGWRVGGMRAVAGQGKESPNSQNTLTRSVAVAPARGTGTGPLLVGFWSEI